MPTKQIRTRKAPGDNLVSTSDESEVALSEDELNRAIGGDATVRRVGESVVEYLKYRLSNIS